MSDFKDWDDLTTTGECKAEYKAMQQRIAELQAKLAACEPYLKEGETPVECISRNRKDTSMAMGEWAKALKRAEKAEAQVDRVNVCDVCGGDPSSVDNCACNGTGQMHETVVTLRQTIFELQEQVDALKRSRILSHKYAGCTADNCRLDGVECSQALQEQKP